MDLTATWWPLLAAVTERLIAIAVSSHAVLTKRETRTIIGWVGLIWLAPILGSVVYLCFGINRLRRRGGQLQKRLERVLSHVRPRLPKHEQELLAAVKQQYPAFRQMTDLVDDLTGTSLLPGNAVRPLPGGETAYPAMLEAIAGAQHTVALQSYIFDNDRAGQLFIDALADARRRGLEVRVLVDAVGARYTRPTAVRVMQKAGLICHEFLPTHLPHSTVYSNLRNHRKLLIVDGTVSFTGGMNIREGCRLDWHPSHPVQDLHFRFEGPVSLHLQEAFAVDWCFAAGEVLEGAHWFPETGRRGTVWCRGIADGPDEDFEKLKMTILGAISVAQKSVVIVTPYFLPDETLIAALNVASLRGVQVQILIPEINNIRLVQWASIAILPELLERGCKVYLTPPPFDHTKLFLIDGVWSLIGSTNWDPRSLRLNFEFNVECYSQELTRQLTALADDKRQRSRPLTLSELQQRHWLTRLRDGVSRMTSPYI